MSALLSIDSLDHLITTHETCVFLDTARPDRAQRYSLLFTNPRKIVRCTRTGDVGRCIENVSREAATSWVAGFMAYEAAYGLEDRFNKYVDIKYNSGADLVWFGIFDTPFIFDHGTGGWNRPIPSFRKSKQRATDPATCDLLQISPRISKGAYGRKVLKIKQYIADGDIYQANFTYENILKARQSPWRLYKKLRIIQPVPFGAFIKTDNAVVASFSPELFFMQQGNLIRTRPMKGTAPRGFFTADDDAIAARLARDPKNRSENVMIVDLLRNNLGKICVTGSVAAKNLFSVERHPTVHQMTSTVEGRLRAEVGFAGIFSALFPCGSVTGAPKIRAMEIIRDCECRSRGVYCGAIGYSSPHGRRVFSVPIRTLEKRRGNKHWHFGVGSGIVGDSVPEQEWLECGDKCKFLSEKRPPFSLVETILFLHGAPRYLRDHWRRLADSALYFNYAVSKTEWDSTIAAVRHALAASDSPHRVRIVVGKNGCFSWEHERIAPEKAAPRRVVFLSKKPINPESPFLYHKTTYRPWYEKDLPAIRGGSCFDVLHVNTKGHLTEGARTNLFVKINNILYTPPVHCGLLPGVLRQRLLDSGKCFEKIFTLKDLRRAGALYCGNSVRGLVEVTL